MILVQYIWVNPNPSWGRYLLQILLAASNKAITRKWMSKEFPTKLECIEIVTEIYSMERLIFSLKRFEDKFTTYWRKW